MVKIENIARKGKEISMDCYEEGDRERSHHVVFDADTLKITNNIKNNIYIRQSIAKIWDYLMDGSELPKQAMSYWC